MPPFASARRPRSGRPPRLMPTPSEPQPVPLHGGTNAGVGPLRVCAFDRRAAPRAAARRPPRDPRGPRSSAPSARTPARARRRAAPRSSSSAQRGRRAGARGGHQRRLAAGIGGIRDRRRRRAAAGSSSALPLTAGEVERRHAVAIAGAGVRAGPQQQHPRSPAGPHARRRAAPSVPSTRVALTSLPCPMRERTAARSPRSAASANGTPAATATAGSSHPIRTAKAKTCRGDIWAFYPGRPPQHERFASGAVGGRRRNTKAVSGLA